MNQQINIVVISTDSHKAYFGVSATCTIATIIKALKQQRGEVGNIELYMNNTKLTSSMTIAQCGITNNTTLYNRSTQTPPSIKNNFEGVDYINITILSEDTHKSYLKVHKNSKLDDVITSFKQQRCEAGDIFLFKNDKLLSANKSLRSLHIRDGDILSTY